MMEQRRTTWSWCCNRIKSCLGENDKSNESLTTRSHIHSMILIEKIGLIFISFSCFLSVFFFFLFHQQSYFGRADQFPLPKSAMKLHRIKNSLRLSVAAQLHLVCEHRPSVGHQDTRDQRREIRHQETVQVCHHVDKDYCASFSVCLSFFCPIL